jgi:hypothetical protein
MRCAMPFKNPSPAKMSKLTCRVVRQPCPASEPPWNAALLAGFATCLGWNGIKPAWNSQ